MITYRAGDSSAKNTKSHINRRITGPILLAFHSFTILLTIRVADGTFWLLISKILNSRRFARPFQQLVGPKFAGNFHYVVGLGSRQANYTAVFSESTFRMQSLTWNECIVVGRQR